MRRQAFLALNRCHRAEAAAVLLLRQIPEVPETAGEGVVDPQVHRTEFVLDPGGGSAYRVDVRHIGWNPEPAAAGGLDVLDRAVQSRLTTRQDGDVPAMFGQFPDDGPAHTSGTAGDDRDASVSHDLPDVPDRPS